ncbi:hypothetical protein [Amycolatopsis sp. lyj-23]|uniref:hypothetical protein n=1 Tax=Amycolatopsis sp. lyj-23 TaxID=2789283 RepID=UPI003977EDEB
MTAARAGCLDSRPGAAGDFGAYRWGLEPLFLPDPLGSDPRPSGGSAAATPDSPGREAKTGQYPAHSGPDEIYWFRWITGHQVTFLLWQFLARALERVGPGGAADGKTADAVERLTVACNAVLVYTGSCSRECYDRIIRPAMYRHHHGFSGSWSMDYRPVRRLLHTRQQAWLSHPDMAKVRAAANVNALVHNAIAARLVPGGPSLLSTAVPEMRLQDRATLGVMFDIFFLTVRRPVDDGELVRQLVRRLKAVVADVGENGLLPEGSQSFDEVPARFRAPFLYSCERLLPEVLGAVAALSAELVAEPAI